MMIIAFSNNPQRIWNIEPFINQDNWKGIDFPSYSKDWKKFEQNGKSIAINILYVPYSTKEIRLACKSKHNQKRKNQVILLMITDGEKWYYLAVKNLPRLLREITSNHNGDFYCLNCFHSHSIKNRLKKHERVCNDHDYCHVEMPNEDNKTLEYNHEEKSLQVPFIIDVDIESLLLKMPFCQNNPEKSYTEKKAKYIPSG